MIHRITVDPIEINLNIAISDDRATQAKVDELTAKLVESQKKIEDALNKKGD